MKLNVKGKYKRFAIMSYSRLQAGSSVDDNYLKLFSDTSSFVHGSLLEKPASYVV